MAKIVYKIDGLEELNKKLRKNINLADVKRVVSHNGKKLQDKIQGNANFKKGYATGQTKKSVGLSIKDGGFTAESGPTTEYSEYLERGTRLLDAQPFVKPAFDEQKETFKQDLQKLVK